MAETLASRPAYQGCLHAEPIETVDIRRGDATRLGKCGLARFAGELTQCLVPSPLISSDYPGVLLPTRE
jgi:hypothetical protein